MRWTPTAIVSPDQLTHALTLTGIIPPNLYKTEPTQMDKYIADFVAENNQNQEAIAAWEAAL